MNKTTILRFLVPVGALLVATAMAELALRLTGFSSPTYTVPDRVRGWALLPAFEGVIRGENSDGVYVTINQDGFRDRNHTSEKPSGTLRIAVLGDSYAEAVQVPLEATFWTVMERRLSTCRIPGTSQLEVLNFGVSGYGTAQEFLTLGEKVWKYRPDIVMLAVTTGNDVSDNLVALSHEPARPYYVYRNGELSLDESFLSVIRPSWSREWFRELARHLRVAQLAYAANRRIGQLRQGREQGGPGQAEAGLDDGIYLPPHDAGWQEAWRVTEGIMRLMAAEVVRQGARFWIATLSNSIQVHPDPTVRRSVMQRLGVDTLFYPDERIRDFGLREGIPVITVAESMARHAEEQHLFLHGFGGSLGAGHWNQNGHRAAGELIAEELCSHLGSPR